MEESGLNKIFETLGKMYLLFMVIIVLVVIFNYVSLSVALDKTMHRAEIEGHLDYDTYVNYLDKLKVNKSSLVVENVSPAFGSSVAKLGDPLEITVSSVYKFTLFGQQVPIKFSVTKDGINQGYYGGGY